MPPCAICGTEVVWTGLFGGEPVCRDCRRRKPNAQALEGDDPPSSAPPYVTRSLLAVAILASLIYWLNSPSAQWLMDDRPDIWDGQLWRLFLSIFPHGNILHLAFNLYWTWQFGRLVEQWMGSLRFAGFVILTALGSSAAQFLLEGPGIGLSGVGYALFGLLFALRRDREFAAREMTPQIVQMFVLWFFFCVFLTYTGAYAIGNAAHGAGAVIGWLVGRAILARRPVWLLAGLTAIVMALTGACLYMPWNPQYALHRAMKAAERGDAEAMMYWFGKAGGAFPGGLPPLDDPHGELPETDK